MAIGIYMIIGRFFYDAYRRSKTRYAVSNQRVLILYDGVRPEIQSLDLRSLGEINLTFGRSGSGSIFFGHAPAKPRGTFPGGDDGRPKFDMIDRAQTVHTLIRDAQRKAQETSSETQARRWGV